jgi:hypothetical protein
MPNKFKYNKTGAEANSIFKGNWAINNTPANTGGGPSSATSFYHGANIPAGGYTVYSPNGVFIANNDTELVGKINSLGANVTGASQALTWAAAQSTHMVLNKPIDNIVASGLVLNVDASNVSSFNDSQPTINKVTNAATFNGGWASYSNGNDGTFITEFGTTGYRMSNRGSWNGVYQNFDVGAAGTYTFSAWIKYIGNAAPVTGGAVYISNYGGGDTAAAVDKGLVGVWQRVKHTVNVTLPGNVYFYLISWGGTYGGDNHSWEVTMPQIESGSIATPFVNGTRTQTSTCYDLSGNGNAVTLINGVTTDSNRGLSFDGVDDYGVLNAFANKPTSAITCESLIKPIKGTVAHTIRGGAISSSNTMYLGIINSIDGTTHAMHWANQTNASRLYNWNGSVPDNRWSHLVGTYDGATAKAYVNGVLIDSWAQTGTIPDATYYIGTYGGTVVDGTHNFDGNIETARIYNRGLTSTEILQNYYNGPIVTSGLTFALDAGNLVSYESGSTTTYSLIGSETGTLLNGVGYNTGNGGSWTFDGVDDSVQLNSSVIPAGNEISISFWNFGINAPSSSIIAASFNSSDQTLNVHLPWSNNGIYWDCGYPFNRIDKIATNAEYQGWHNWVFTKNATTGNMSIYLDGNLWHSGSGLTSTIPTMTVARMGSYWNNNLAHSGRIAQCLIHNRALTADEVKENFSAHRNRFGI